MSLVKCESTQRDTGILNIHLKSSTPEVFSRSALDSSRGISQKYSRELRNVVDIKTVMLIDALIRQLLVPR